MSYGVPGYVSPVLLVVVPFCRQAGQHDQVPAGVTESRRLARRPRPRRVPLRDRPDDGDLTFIDPLASVPYKTPERVALGIPTLKKRG